MLIVAHDAHVSPHVFEQIEYSDHTRFADFGTASRRSIGALSPRCGSFPPSTAPNGHTQWLDHHMHRKCATVWQHQTTHSNRSDSLAMKAGAFNFDASEMSVEGGYLSLTLFCNLSRSHIRRPRGFQSGQRLWCSAVSRSN